MLEGSGASCFRCRQTGAVGGTLVRSPGRGCWSAEGVEVCLCGEDRADRIVMDWDGYERRDRRRLALILFFALSSGKDGAMLTEMGKLEGLGPGKKGKIVWACPAL